MTRRQSDAALVRRFMAVVGSRVPVEATVYLTGGATAVLHGWRPTTDDVDIKVVADVRSSPASRLPHFNRTALNARLTASGIAYVFLGAELGGRPESGGVADYEQMAATTVFKHGIELVEQIAADTRLTARQRSALREVYEAFAATSPRAGRRRRGAANGSTTTGDER